MRAQAKFSDPSEMPVTITLTGTLKEFEELKAAVLGDLPYWQVRALVDQIVDVSRQLRGTATADAPEQPA